MAVARIGVSLEKPLLKEFDRLVSTRGFRSRSEALRGLVREALAEERRVEGGKVVGTVTIIYRHEVGMVTHRIIHRQHEFLAAIRATAHTHLNEETCLEALLVEGDAREVEQLTNRMKTVKGVLFAETVVASPDLR